jgi:hypothetical protein
MYVMAQIIQLDLTSKPYDEVDQYVRNLTEISENNEWASLKERAFRGIIPKTKNVTFFNIIKNNWKIHNKEYTDQSVHKYFRIDPNPSNFFQTSKPIYTYAIKTKRVFITGADEYSEHIKNIDLFKQLSEIMNVAAMRIYSIQKDNHDGPRSRDSPFMGNYVAVFLIDV